MMDNIQAIIADRQYQGALENQNGTLKPYKPFPKPSTEEYNDSLDKADLSLRAILDSPIGVFEFKKYAKEFPQFPVVIEFLVQYERVKALDAPDLDAAKTLMDLSLQLPSMYASQVNKLRTQFRETFGPLTFVSQIQEPENFVDQRIKSLDFDDEEAFPSDEHFDSKGNEEFPDSTAPVVESAATQFEDATRKSLKISFGGFLHQNRKAPSGVYSSVDTEILEPDNLKIMSDRKLRDISDRKAYGEDTGEGDFDDRQVAQRQREEIEKRDRKKKAIGIFHELAGSLSLKAEELLQTFKDNTPEFREMISLHWYADQKLDVKDFLLFRDLGRGAFGVVSAAKTKTTGTLTAIKCMNKKLVKGKKAKRLVTAEKAILQLLGDNPSNFTIWLQYSFQDKDYFYIAIPLCTGGDLAYHLRKNHCFTKERAIFHFAEILEGIDHLHKLLIVYRDLKPENVIFDAEGHARISDMGLAMQTNGRKIRGKAGTPGYWAPEVITSQPYSFSADHWSLGCVLYEMLTGFCTFSSSNTRMKDRNEGTLKWTVKFPKNVGRNNATARPFPEDAKSLILGLLNRSRTRRFGATEVRDHKFFKGLNWYKLRNKLLKPPWSPTDGTIYAPDQIELDYKSNDKLYKKLKLTEDDEIPNFDYTSKYAHMFDIVKVLETAEKKEIRYDTHYETSCCFCM